MTTIELKKLLINKITDINDHTFLAALKTILDTKAETEVLKLTHEQVNEIIEAKKEIEQGNYTDQETLDKKILNWVNEK